MNASQWSDERSTQSPQTLWVLSDGRPGHESQSKGIVAALEMRRHVQVHWIAVTLRGALWRCVGWRRDAEKLALAGPGPESAY